MILRHIARTILVLLLLLTPLCPPFAHDFAELQKLQADVQRFSGERKYAEALAAQRALAEGIEKLETAKGGKPGADTAGALVGLSWHALFARANTEALAAAERALTLQPDYFMAETNHAHALLLLGRAPQADQIYLKYKGKRLDPGSDKTWDDVLVEDFYALQAAGITDAGFARIIKALGVKNPELTPQIDVLRAQFEQLYPYGKFAEATAVAEKLVPLTSKRFGETRSEYGVALAKLAAGNMRLQRFDVAEPQFKRAISILEKALGLEHAEVGNALNDLAIQYRMQSRPTDGEPLFLRAITIAEKTLGADSLEVSNRLNSIAVLYANAEYLEAAEERYKRSIEIAEKWLTPEHPSMLARLSNLSGLYVTLQRYDEAEALRKKILEGTEKNNGPNDLSVADALGELAAIYSAQQRFGDAEPLLKRIIAIREAALGLEDATVGAALAKLAIQYRIEGGRGAESEPLFKRSLAIAEKRSGPESQEASDRQNSLAVLYLTMDRLGDAEQLLKRSIEIAEKLAPLSVGVAVQLSNLADVYEREKRYAEAETTLRRALGVYMRGIAADESERVPIYNRLATIYTATNRPDEAQAALREAQKILDKLKRQNSQQKETVQDDKGIDLMATNAALIREKNAAGEFENALIFALLYQGLAKQHFGENHRHFLKGLVFVASAYSGLGDYEQAEPEFNRAMQLAQKLLPPNDPDLAWLLSELGTMYAAQGRYAEAEPLYKRALEISEVQPQPNDLVISINLAALSGIYARQGRYAEAEALQRRALESAKRAESPEGHYVSTRLSDLAQLVMARGRYAEAEELLKQSLILAERANGPEHPDVGLVRNNLAALYAQAGRYADAEPLLKRSVEINANTLSPSHPHVATGISNLGMLYLKQGRLADAEQQFKRSLELSEKALGPDHPSTSQTLGDLASMAYERGDWKLAAAYWKRAVDGVILRRKRNANDLGQAMASGSARLDEQRTGYFWGLMKATDGIVSTDASARPAATREMFKVAQWAVGTEAAASLAQMGARGARNDKALAALVRERQDLVAEWQKRDSVRTAATALPRDKRGKADADNAARITAIDARMGEIDRTLKAKFPSYASLANPEPLSVEEVQAALRPDEALVFIVDTPEWDNGQDDTFIWSVTKTEASSVRVNIGSDLLRRFVREMRCGLDASMWDGNACDVLEVKPARDQAGDIIAESLPFDIASANSLYKILLGKVEEQIRGKQLLVVSSGALSQLPLQVLVSSLGTEDEKKYGMQERRVTKLGAKMGELTGPARQDLKRGVVVTGFYTRSNLEQMGLSVGDIILSVDGSDLRSVREAEQLFRSRQKGDTISLLVRRGSDELTVKVKLGSGTIREFVPKYLKVNEDRNVEWLVRTHSITVLPAVSSLQALRRNSKPSAGRKPFVGFGNPLLSGDPTTRPWEAEWAKLAKNKQSCGTGLLRVASQSTEKRRGMRLAKTRSGRADLAELRSQVPLHDTADELCAVAADLKVGADDVLLGGRATEAAVKDLSTSGKLANYRMVHFATHGMLAGDLSGVSEPGLLMTPPDQQTDADDGYLSASEVAELKLDADWVILSACNTAAGGSEKAEALSGLARAFFYAGARALLVSHWAVDSAATVRLTTTAMSAMSREKGMGRAQAMRGAMLGMIDDKGKPALGHPTFWAPFVVVGEGASVAQ
jgi:CHAT domain-containing protein